MAVLIDPAFRHPANDTLSTDMVNYPLDMGAHYRYVTIYDEATKEKIDRENRAIVAAVIALENQKVTLTLSAAEMSNLSVLLFALSADGDSRWTRNTAKALSDKVSLSLYGQGIG